MSRHTAKTKDGREATLGFGGDIGYFMQVWKREDEIGEGEDELLWEIDGGPFQPYLTPDGRIDGRNRYELIRLIELYIEDCVMKNHVLEMIMLDLPF